MMSNLAVIDNPTVRALGAKLMELPYVVDVRFYPVVRGEIRELAGEDALFFLAVIRKDNIIRKAFVIVPSTIYLNEEAHHITVETMAEKIEATVGAIIELTPVIIPETTEEVPNTTEE